MNLVTKLDKFLEREDAYVEPMKKQNTKKKKVKNAQELVEVVEKVYIVEDGRQLLM